jgi:drug/metabolite transporter (DMT)-like permease
MLGLGLGVLGVAVLSAGGGGWSGGLADRLALVASGFCWATGSLIGRDGARPRSAAQATAMQLATGSVALLTMSLVLGEWSAWSPAGLSSRAQLSLGFLILGGTVAGFGAYTWLLRVSTPGAVGSYAFVNPLVAVLLAHLAGDGAIDLRTVVAMTLVLGAVMLTRDVPGPSPENDTSREPSVERGPRLVSPASGTQ